MPDALEPALSRILAAARAEGRKHLLDPEAFRLLREAGVPTPEFAFLETGTQDLESVLARLSGERVVVKAAVPGLLHKAAAGALAVSARRPQAVRRAIDEIRDRLRGRPLRGFTVFSFVPHRAGPGRELLLSLRWTRDFGPVWTVGPGGSDVEFLSGLLKPEAGPWLAEARRQHGGERLPPLPRSGHPPPHRDMPDTRWPWTEALHRNGVHLRLLGEVMQRLASILPAFPDPVAEIEINPLVFLDGHPVALDALVTLGDGPAPGAPAIRSRDTLQALLRPRSIAVVGVSSRRNVGRIILENVLAAGFPPEGLTVVKPGATTVAGCRCVDDVDDLPEPVDLLVVSIAAAHVPDLLDRVVAGRLARAVILIPGGMGESAGSDAVAARIRRGLEAARATGEAPLVVGGNCLGVRSVPGRYNTLFIPREKLPVPERKPVPLALLSQSGAFAVARASRLQGLNPRYTITLGNQLDFTVGEALTAMADDPAIQVAACYVEGFQTGDGSRFLEAARRMTATGRTVILYRAGRTRSGAAATASHTASVAGDYTVTRALAIRAGVWVTESLDAFDDAVQLAVRLKGKPAGPRLGALTNAGFEAVAFADHLSGFTLAEFAPVTQDRLRHVLAAAGLSGIVTVRNPLDVTPILDDAGFVAAVEAVLTDPGVDVGVMGCVPLTGALETLPAHEGWSAEGVVAGLARLYRTVHKPWVAVVDAGAAYDPMAAALQTAGLPVFRSGDRAVRALAGWWRTRTA